MIKKSRDEALEMRRASDAELATALLAGEPGAPDRAWAELSPLVFRILRRFFPASPDNQDLCQEVFLRFFGRITELQDRRSLRKFLTGICMGVAQNARRSAQVRRAVVVPTGDCPDHPIGPFDDEARRAVRRLVDVLASVGAQDRILFTLRHVEKIEVANIAASSGWSLATTKRRLARVTRRVGGRLQRDPAFAQYAGAFRA